MPDVTFKIYNECHLEVRVTCRHREPGGEEAEVTQRVLPGREEAIVATSARQVRCSAATADDEYRWAEQEIVLDRPEYTHVLSCGCDPHTHDCPQIILHAPSRQMPIADRPERSGPRRP